MKKITTLLAASAVAVSAFATPTVKTPQPLAAPPANLTRADSDAPEVITDTPEGSMQLYSRAGTMYIAFWNMVFPVTHQGLELDVVTDGEGTLYFKNVISSAVTDSWVKASRDGDDVKIPVGQCVGWFEDYGNGYMIGCAKYDAEAGGYVYDEDVADIIFHVDADGVMKLDEMYGDADGDGQPEYLFSLFYMNDKSWAGSSESNTVCTPVYDTPQLFPDDIALSAWVMEAYSPNPEDGDEPEYKNVTCGVKDGKFYLGALVDGSPNSVVVGTIADGKVTFPSGQYLGPDGTGYLGYFAGGTYTVEEVYDEDYEEYTYIVHSELADALTFTYDEQAQRLSPIGENALLAINAGSPSTGTLVLFPYANPTISKLAEGPAVPANPSIIGYEDYFDEYGCFAFGCDIPCADQDGNFINASDLYYIIWYDIDGEQEEYVFLAEEYPSIESELQAESIVEVPYNFSSMGPEGFYGIDPAGEKVIIFTAMPDNFGVQSVYYGGGERHVSEIGWYNTSGVKSVGDKAATAEAYYGIDGMRHASAVRGLNIVKMSDGSVRKVLVK